MMTTKTKMFILKLWIIITMNFFLSSLNSFFPITHNFPSLSCIISCCAYFLCIMKKVYSSDRTFLHVFTVSEKCSDTLHSMQVYVVHVVSTESTYGSLRPHWGRAPTATTTTSITDTILSVMRLELYVFHQQLGWSTLYFVYSYIMLW